MTTDEQFDQLRDDLRSIADYVVRQAEPKRQPKPQPKRGAGVLNLLFTVLVFAVLGGATYLLFGVGMFGLPWPQFSQAQPTTVPALPTAAVAPPQPRSAPVVVVPQYLPTDAPAPVSVAPSVPQAAPEVAPISPDAQPDMIAVNTDRAMGGTGDTAPLPDVLPTVVPGVPVAPYDASDPVAAETYRRAMLNSGVDVDATATVMAEIGCNADLAAGGAGCP